MAVLQRGSPWGELSPVGQLRGVMVIICFAETPLRHRCAMPPAPGRFSFPTGNLPCLAKYRLCYFAG